MRFPRDNGYSFRPSTAFGPSPSPHATRWPRRGASAAARSRIRPCCSGPGRYPGARSSVRVQTAKGPAGVSPGESPFPPALAVSWGRRLIQRSAGPSGCVELRDGVGLRRWCGVDVSRAFDAGKIAFGLADLRLVRRRMGPARPAPAVLRRPNRPRRRLRLRPRPPGRLWAMEGRRITDGVRSLEVAPPGWP